MSKYEPAEKSLSMGMILETLSGRTSAIHDAVCISPPFGCGLPVQGFTSDLAEREYAISGMCESCQERIFG